MHMTLSQANFRTKLSITLARCVCVRIHQQFIKTPFSISAFSRGPLRPVAGGDLEEELLQFANMDFSSNDIVINNNGNDGDGGGDAATAYFMGQRNSPNHPFSSVL